MSTIHLHQNTTSTPEEFTSGTWAPVIDDRNVTSPDAIRRVALTRGKVYYDLDKQRGKSGRDDVAIVRLEQLYPLPAAELSDVLERYPSATEVVWVQEEPANQGVWPYIAVNLPDQVKAVTAGGRTLRRMSRAAAASPAAGSHHTHEVEQQNLLDDVFGA